MTEAHSPQAVSDLATLCDPAASPAARAAGLLRRMHEVAPHAAAAVSFVDPASQHHRVLASRGYRGPVLEYLMGDFVGRDQGWRFVRERRETLHCWADLPGYREAFSAREVFAPEGYAEGTSVCLVDERGQVAGALHISVREAELPSAVRTSAGTLQAAFTQLATLSAGRAASGLTARELEILRLVADGLSNAQIADRLILARRTVATHVEHILAKLGARNRVEASVRAVRLGLW